jgi:hypothetical protein
LLFVNDGEYRRRQCRTTGNDFHLQLDDGAARLGASLPEYPDANAGLCPANQEIRNIGQADHSIGNHLDLALDGVVLELGQSSAARRVQRSRIADVILLGQQAGACEEQKK